MAAYRLSNADATWLLAHALKFLHDKHHETAGIDPSLFDAPTHTPGYHFQTVWQQGDRVMLAPHHDATALQGFCNRLKILHHDQPIGSGEMLGILLTRFGDKQTRIRTTFGITRLHGENTLSIIENYSTAHRHRRNGIAPLPDQFAELVYEGTTTAQPAATLSLFRDYVTAPALPEFGEKGPFRRVVSTCRR